MTVMQLPCDHPTCSNMCYHDNQTETHIGRQLDPLLADPLGEGANLLCHGLKELVHCVDSLLPNGHPLLRGVARGPLKEVRADCSHAGCKPNQEVRGWEGRGFGSCDYHVTKRRV